MNQITVIVRSTKLDLIKVALDNIGIQDLMVTVLEKAKPRSSRAASLTKVQALVADNQLFAISGALSELLDEHYGESMFRSIVESMTRKRKKRKGKF